MKTLLALPRLLFVPKVHHEITYHKFTKSNYLIPNRDEKFVSRSFRTGLVTECVNLGRS